MATAPPADRGGQSERSCFLTSVTLPGHRSAVTSQFDRRLAIACVGISFVTMFATITSVLLAVHVGFWPAICAWAAHTAVAIRWVQIAG